MFLLSKYPDNHETFAINKGKILDILMVDDILWRWALL